jgi:hypothetical protein
MKRSILFLLLLSQLSLSIGCYRVPYRPVEAGLTGGAIGATTGGLIGATIANGDIVASAGLGAVVGIPTGIVLGSRYLAEKENERNLAIAHQTHEQKLLIERNSDEIKIFREKLLLEEPSLPAKNRRIKVYDGAILGNYYR